MTVNTTNITGFIVLPDDTVREKSSVIFTMTGFDTDADDNATVVPIPREAPIAVDGSIDIDLWPNPEGVRSTFYRVTFSIYNGNKPYLIDGGLIEVPVTGGPYDLNDLLPIAPPQGATVEEYIAQLAAAVAAAESAAASAEIDADRAEAAAAAASLEVDDRAGVDALTDADLGIGGYVLQRDAGILFERVASGGDVTNTGGIDLTGVGAERNILGYLASPVSVRGVDTSAELTGDYFGMTGNTTINTQAWLDAATALTASKGGVLYVPEGYQSLDSPIALPANTWLRLHPKAVIEFGGAANEAAFTWAGSDGTPVSVTADLAEGDLFATVGAGDEADFVPGHFAKIVSTEEFDPTRTGTKKGELVRIRVVSSGTVSFWEPLRDSYALADGTVTIKPVTMAGKCGIEGGALIGSYEAASNELFGLQFRFCERPFVRNVSLGRFDERATFFPDCDHPYVGDLKSFDSVSDGTGYLVSFANATRGGIAERITGYNQRHMTSTNNEGAEGGVVRDVIFRDMHCAWTSTALGGSMTPGDMYDTHAAADGVLFERCAALYARSAAFNIECPNVTIKDCSAHRPVRRAINAINYSDKLSKIRIENFTVARAGEEAIFVGGGQTRGSNTSSFHDVVEINGVSAVAASGNTDIAVHVETDSGRMSRVRTKNMDLNGFGGPDVVRVDNAVIWEASGCSGSDNAGEFYRAFDVDHVIFDLGTPEVAASQSVLYVDDTATSVRVNGGRPTQSGAATGIRVEAGAIDVQVRGTDLSAMGARYNLGAGNAFETDDRDQFQLRATIASGVVTGLRPHTKAIMIDTEGGAATDNLWEIDGSEAYNGQVIVLVAQSTARDVTVKDASGGSPEGTPNIRTNASTDFTLLDNTYTITLAYRAGVWREVSNSAN